MPETAKLKAGMALAFLLAAGSVQPTQASDRMVSITATGTMVTTNPYGDSSTQNNHIWCNIYGCLFRFNPSTNEYDGVLAESWENVSPNVWRITLRDDLVRHDGGPPPRSDDVIHTMERIAADPESQQRHRIANFERIVAIDERTFEIHTYEPDATLINGLADHFIVTSRELHDAHGARNADNNYPYGWGPFKLTEFVIDNRIVLTRSEHWAHEAGVPQTVIFVQMREPSQRVTAALNGEVQIAREIPPQLLSRFEGRNEINLIESDSIELMFLAMNPAFEPWDDLRIRRAAAMAINRDAIIDRLLRGMASKLEGPVGPTQFCYSGPPDRANEYNPAAARTLLAEAGYPDGGPSVSLFVSSGRYLADREIGQVFASMLEEVGFDVALEAQEWGTLWAAIRSGSVPFYYVGRGSVVDPSDAVIQYFGTDETPRIGYSNPELDELLVRQLTEFDAEKRCALWREINQLIIDDVPAHFMWTHKFSTAIASGLTAEILTSGELWLPDMRY